MIPLTMPAQILHWPGLEVVEVRHRRSYGFHVVGKVMSVWHVTPTGKFVIGGPDDDCGLIGRKVFVGHLMGRWPLRSRSGEHRVIGRRRAD
jgi:hypothetical protein